MITGGASGFGFAVAEHLARGGSDLALLDIDGERVGAAAATLAGDHGITAVGHRVDMASTSEVQDAERAVRESLGRCDLLWANVGVQHFGSVENTGEDVWRWMLDVNVVGAVRLVQVFLPMLRESRDPHIALTASANALAPAARLGAYQASKFGVVGLAETLRIELAPESIPVSVVYPSGMPTRHLESSALARPSELGSGQVSPEDLEAMMASRPLGPSDLVDATVAAESALAGVLSGEAHVITHGDLVEPVRALHSEIERALSRVTGRSEA